MSILSYTAGLRASSGPRSKGLRRASACARAVRASGATHSREPAGRGSLCLPFLLRVKPTSDGRAVTGTSLLPRTALHSRLATHQAECVLQLAGQDITLLSQSVWHCCFSPPVTTHDSESQDCSPTLGPPWRLPLPEPAPETLVTSTRRPTVTLCHTVTALKAKHDSTPPPPTPPHPTPPLISNLEFQPSLLPPPPPCSSMVTVWPHNWADILSVASPAVPLPHPAPGQTAEDSTHAADAAPPTAADEAAAPRGQAAQRGTEESCPSGATAGTEGRAAEQGTDSCANRDPEPSSPSVPEREGVLRSMSGRFHAWFHGGGEKPHTPFDLPLDLVGGDNDWLAWQWVSVRRRCMAAGRHVRWELRQRPRVLGWCGVAGSQASALRMWSPGTRLR